MKGQVGGVHGGGCTWGDGVHMGVGVYMGGWGAHGGPLSGLTPEKLHPTTGGSTYCILL